MLTEERPKEKPPQPPEGTPAKPDRRKRPRGAGPAAGSRRLDVQGLRAIAVILVVLFHARLPVEGGFIGVDVFLVISGFVITGMLLRELQGTGTIRFRRFYSRRIKRLLPALALLTTVVVVLSIFFGSSFGSQQTTARTGLGATYFVANYVIYEDSIGYFSPEAETNPLLHTWTLSVEEQVYLIFPALLLGSWAVGRTLAGGRKQAGRRSRPASRRAAVAMLVVVSVASFVFSVLVSFSKTGLPPAFAFFSSLARVWEFALGALLALWGHRLRSIHRGAATVLGLLGAAVIVAGAFLLSGEMPYPGVAVLLPVLGAAAVITAGFRPDTPVARALATRPMVKIGDLSYSWYLWHWPLIVFASVIWPDQRGIIVAAALLSIIPAWLSTALMEDPIRHNERIKGGRVVALALVCLLIPTAACIGLAQGAERSWGNESVAAMQEQVTEKHLAEVNKCDDAAETGSSLEDEACTFNEEDAAPAAGTGTRTRVMKRDPAIYLVGNSVAAMYSEAVVGASGNLDFPVTLDTSHGCFSAGQADSRDCTDNFTGTVDKLVRSRPGIVFMASTWDLGSFGGNEGKKNRNTPQEKAGFLRDSLIEAVSRLHEAGHHVVLIIPIPRFFHDPAHPGSYLPLPDPSLPRQEAHASLWRPTDCSALTAQNDTAACGATVRESAVESAQALTMRALDKVALRTGATTLELRSRYCSGGICRTNSGDRWMYEDGVHISVGESQALIPTFTGLLRQVVKDEWRVQEREPKDEAGKDDPKAHASPPPGA